MEHLRTIERLIKRRITRRKAPTFSEALEGAQQAAIRSLITTTEEGNFGTYKENAEELLSNYDSAALVAAAIKLLTKEPDTTPVKITEEAPLRVHRSRNNRGDRNNRRYNRNDRRGDRRNRKDDGEGNSEHRGERRRHFAPKNRDNNRNNSRNNQRRENKQHKEPNRSVFKPYFKD